MSAQRSPALTPEQLQVLHVLTDGLASRAPFTRSDLAAGYHCVQSRVASELVALGLARNVSHWKAVEITGAGLDALGRYGHLRSGGRSPR